MNYIKITKNNDNNKYHDFYTLEFVNNGQVVAEEKETCGCLLCTVDFEKSVNYIIGKNYNFEQNEIFKEFAEPLKNYFLIFIKGVDVSDILKNCTIIDPYDFYTVAIKDDKEIDRKSYRALSAPLINSKGELFWQPKFSDFVNDELYIHGEKYLNVPNLYASRNFIKHQDISEDNYIKIYFYKRECLSYYMAYEICKNADTLEILPNKFEDDIDTINYCAKFSKDRIDDIAFIHYCLDKRGKGHKAYFNNLYGAKSKGYGCAGTAIYNIPYAEYLKGLNWIMNYEAQFVLSDEQKNNFKELVRFIYNKYDIKPNYTKLPEIFTNNLVLEDDFLDKLTFYVDSNYYRYEKCGEPSNLKTRELNTKYNNEKEKLLKQKYQDLKQELLKKNIYSTKWKSEMDLFKLVYSHFADAIYQYRVSWLGSQSIDIYVPSKKIAFEYQGQQHYEPINFWGGEEGFEYRQKLDEQKRRLCKENHVKLIEWRYDEPISKIMLDKKIGKL